MLKIKRAGRLTEVIVLSWNHLWIIFILILVTMVVTYFTKQILPVVIGLGSGLLLLMNFIASRKIVIDKQKNTIRLGYHVVEVKNIRAIKKGMRKPVSNVQEDDDYDAVTVELSDGKKILFPSRFSFSILGVIDELIDFLNKELNLIDK